MTVQEASYLLTNKLRIIYDESEATTIAEMVMENLTGSPRVERMKYKHVELSKDETNKLNHYLERLLKNEPVQYILNEAWFGGFKFYVDENVLIPRPETDELVEWVITDCKFPISELSILDIGTGSGCIPVTLKRRLRKAMVSACDISEAALKVAQKNSNTMNVDIQFLCLDFLHPSNWPQLPEVDIIISNPPYIPIKDKSTIEANVLAYEPHTALFVTDDDPLLFYKAIAVFGKTHLKSSGVIYCEIHESMGDAVAKIFNANGYQCLLKQDMQEKTRMIKASFA
ncbi:MAG TPA: peptide chain release factor N(5)-glutamine methyltransferase [Chitinophagaceae bacterium]|nr:peptide chain release factor N(5)-glutamine methyltransferase [Chitinophagaceae bacterium]